MASPSNQCDHYALFLSHLPEGSIVAFRWSFGATLAIVTVGNVCIANFRPNNSADNDGVRLLLASIMMTAVAAACFLVVFLAEQHGIYCSSSDWPVRHPSARAAQAVAGAFVAWNAMETLNRCLKVSGWERMQDVRSFTVEAGGCLFCRGARRDQVDFNIVSPAPR